MFDQIPVITSIYPKISFDSKKQITSYSLYLTSRCDIDIILFSIHTYIRFKISMHFA